MNALFNAHMLHSSTTDPFKLALYKLMGKIDPTRRSVPLVTVTTEDWLWFQLAMVRCTLSSFERVILYDWHRWTRMRMAVFEGWQRSY